MFVLGELNMRQGDEASGRKLLTNLKQCRGRIFCY